MTITYTITNKDASNPDYPYGTKELKLLPSVIFTAGVGDLVPEPVVTITLTFSNSLFAMVNELVLSGAISKTIVNQNTIEYKGIYSDMKLLFDQGTGVSRVYQSWNNSKTQGVNFFYNYTIDILVTDNVGNISEKIWTFSPPLTIEGNTKTLSYLTSQDRFNNIFQFTNKHSSINDRWHFDLFWSIYDTQNTNIGNLQVDLSSSNTTGYSGIYDFRYETSMGPYNLNGNNFGILGNGCDFFYEISNGTIEYWGKDVSTISKQTRIARVSINNTIEKIKHTYAYNNFLIVSYYDVDDLIDVFFYNGMMTFRQTIHLANNSERHWLQQDAIQDGSEITTPTAPFFMYNNTLLAFTAANRNDYVLSYTLIGQSFVVSDVAHLTYSIYKGIFWINDRTFIHIAHNTEIPLFLTKLTVYRKNGPWGVYFEDTTPNADTVQNFKQSGPSPFYRLIVSKNTDLYYISYLNNYHGELYQDNGTTYENIKVINKDYPGYNSAEVVMYYDSLFYLRPESVADLINYKKGDIYHQAFGLIENATVTNKLYWDRAGDEGGWIAHYQISPAIESLFHYGIAKDVFWGSVNHGYCRSVPIDEINLMLQNLSFSPSINWRKSVPVFWVLTNVGDSSSTMGGMMTLGYDLNNPPIWITPAGSLGKLSFGATVNIQLQAQDFENDSVTYSLIDGTLPIGVVLFGSGLMSGTAQQSGIFQFTLKVTDSHGAYALRQFSMLVSNSVTNTNLPPVWHTGTDLGSFNEQSNIALQLIAADPNNDVLTYTIVSGTLPGTLVLSSTGLLFGKTPTVTSETTYNFSAKVDDGHGGFATQNFTFKVLNSVTVNSLPVWITQSGNIGIVNEQSSFNFQLVAMDLNGDTLTYTIASGDLPSGLSMNNNGTISGTISTVYSTTTYTFTVVVDDGFNSNIPRTFSIDVVNSINESPVWVTPVGSIGTVNGSSTFNFQLSATDPNGNVVSYSIVSGALPSGLSMNSSGLITGTAGNTSGVSNFTVQASDGNGGTADRTFSISVVYVNYPPVWSTATSSIGSINVGDSFNYTLQATDQNNDTLTYSLQSGTLPSGLFLNSSGLISGVASSVGSTTTSNFTIRVSDGNGGTSDRSFSIIVSPNKKFFLFGVDTNGTPGVMYVSSDGNTLTKVTNSPFYNESNPIWSIAHNTAAGIWVAGGSGFLCYSYDGLTWVKPSTQLNTSVNHEYAIQGLAYGNGIFIACGGWHSQFAQRSTDGINWTDITTATRAAGISYVNSTTVAYGNGRFVMHNYYGGTAWSTDGITWTSVVSPPSYGTIVFHVDKFIVGGYGGNGTYYYSTDGITWVTANVFPGGNGGSSQNIITGESKVYFGGLGFSYSNDGLNWTDQTSNFIIGGYGTSKYPHMAMSDTNCFVISYFHNQIWKSSNGGDTWTTDGQNYFANNQTVYIQGNTTFAKWC
jgi:hypothetical protein